LPVGDVVVPLTCEMTTEKLAWAAVGTADKAAGTDVVRSMAQRAGATITEIEGSHVIMISQPDAVLQVILTALEAVSGRTLATTAAD